MTTSLQTDDQETSKALLGAVLSAASVAPVALGTGGTDRLAQFLAGDRLVRAALEAGASAYLTKDGDPEELGAAIEAVKTGATYLARSVRFAVSEPDRRPPAVQEILSPVPLTRREREILALVAQGMTARDIAGRLGISPLTARKHRENLLRKLNLHSAAELTAYAVRLGLPAG